MTGISQDMVYCTCICLYNPQSYICSLFLQKVADLEKKIRLLELRLSGSIEDNLDRSSELASGVSGSLSTGSAVETGSSKVTDTSLVS